MNSRTINKRKSELSKLVTVDDGNKYTVIKILARNLFLFDRAFLVYSFYKHNNNLSNMFLDRLPAWGSSPLNSK